MCGRESDVSNWEHEYFDLAKNMMTVFIGFGNGYYDEARVVGESEEAIIAFCRMVEMGGYKFSETLPKKRCVI